MVCTVGPCTGLKSRPRPGPQTWFEAPTRARSSCADLARARSANWIMRPGPGPARNNYVQARPAKQFHIWGPARGPRARAGPGPQIWNWPDHIGLRNSKIIIVYTFECDCLVVMFTITCTVFPMFVWSLVWTSIVAIGLYNYPGMPNIASPVI